MIFYWLVSQRATVEAVGQTVVRTSPPRRIFSMSTLLLLLLSPVPAIRRRRSYVGEMQVLIGSVGDEIGVTRKDADDKEARGFKVG